MNDPSRSYSSLLDLLVFLFAAPDFFRFLLLLMVSIFTATCLRVHGMKKN